MTPEQNAHVKTLTTAKEIYNYVVTHLKNQGSQSLSVDDFHRGAPFREICAYRGADNKMCAVGCLIADDEYYPEMEGSNVNALLSNYRHLDRLEPHTAMLAELQSLHDRPNFFAQSEEEKILLFRRLEAFFFDLSA